MIEYKIKVSDVLVSTLLLRMDFKARALVELDGASWEYDSIAHLMRRRYTPNAASQLASCMSRVRHLHHEAERALGDALAAKNRSRKGETLECDGDVTAHLLGGREFEALRVVWGTSYNTSRDIIVWACRSAPTYVGI